ncbi:MAG: hypothetical protein U9R01_07070, partial [candidate division WOR-3 bacterium]|nr:hypothetical protein [candidate division WOR-3 bacterium]
MSSVTIRNKTTSTDLHWNTYEITAHMGDSIDKLVLNIPKDDVVSTLDNIVVLSNSTEIWGGFAKDKGKWKPGGTKEIEVLGYGSDIINKQVTLNLVDKSPEYILEQAVSGTGYVIITPVATGITVSKYKVSTTIGQVFADMMARSGYKIRFTPELDASSNRKIYFESVGYLSSGYSYNSATDNIKINEWREEIIETVVNKVKVIGQGKATDLTVADLQESTASGTALNPENMIDGNTITYAQFQIDDYAIFTFKKPFIIHRFRYHGYATGRLFTFKVYYWSLSTSSWVEWWEETSFYGQNLWDAWQNLAEVLTTKIKIVRTSGGAYYTLFLKEIEVEGTSGRTLPIKYEGTASDSTSITNYGERFEKCTLDYIQSDSEATAIANTLLVPNPKSGGNITAAWDGTIMVNETVALVDNVRGINGNYTVLEQKIGNGLTTLHLGWTKRQGILDEHRAEIELRKERAKTLGASLDSDEIQVDISDTSTTDPGSTNSSDGTGITNDTTDPGSTNSSDGTGITNDTTDPGSTNSSDGTGITNDTTDPGSTNSSDGTGITNDTTDPGSTNSSDGTAITVGNANTVPGVTPRDEAQAIGSTVNNQYDSGWIALTYPCSCYGTDKEDEFVIEVWLNTESTSWATIPSKILVSVWLNTAADGTGSDMYLFKEVLNFPHPTNVRFIRKWFSIPTDAIYQINNNMTIIRSFKVRHKILDGNSPTGDVVTTCHAFIVKKHTHSASVMDPKHLHTITGDSHLHLVIDPKHLHTITGDSHLHLVIDPKHLHTIT